MSLKWTQYTPLQVLVKPHEADATEGSTLVGEVCPYACHRDTAHCYS